MWFSMVGRLDGHPVRLWWRDGVLVAPAAVWGALAEATATGRWVSASPTGPSWPTGVAGHEQAWFSLAQLLDELIGVRGDRPGPYPLPSEALG